MTSADLVLIADNDAAVGCLLSELLRDRGLGCELVYDGEAALARLRQGGVAVLVTDLDMPVLTGQELLARFDEVEEQPQVVVVSGFVDAQVEADLAGVAAVRHVLRKPFDVMHFTELVAAMVSRETGAEKS